MTLRFAIDRTWDGAPVADADRAAVVVDWGASVVTLEVDAPWNRDPAPAPPPGPTDRLWEHEVVEWFVVGAGEVYTELELGPFGHHLLLRLVGVRQPVATRLPVVFAAERRGDRWWGRAEVDRSLFPEAPIATNAYRIAGVGADRRYFAHAPVPGAAPDFHRLHAFARWPSVSGA